MAIIDRIKFDGRMNGPHWLVYKYPSEQFVLGSQLVVNQGQEALFFKGGEALDLFGPGTHTLSTGNLPVLHKLVNLPFGGKTPFTAEVYYVNKTVKLDLKWGTPIPIDLEDPKYGLLLHVGARGQYGICINDSRLFISRMVGAIPNGAMTDYTKVLQYFVGVINTKIKTIISQYMIKARISFLEISAYLDELSQAFHQAVSDEFERFGVEVVNFFCESITPPPEEIERLRQMKEELALGDGFYMTRRSLDIAERLAANPSAGGIANAGIGLGLGLGAAGQFGNIFSGIAQNMQANNPITQPSVAATPISAPSNEITCSKCGAKNNSQMKFCGSCGNKLAVTIICPHCGKTVPDGMKFCGECGKSLTSSRCPSCGFENKIGMKFCGNCGGKL